jgi:hypothetical protein
MELKWFKECHSREGSWFSCNEKEPATDKEAWEKTFEKWYLIAKDHSTIMIDSAHNCGLCNLYRYSSKRHGAVSIDCKGCPISMYTCIEYCLHTPFSSAVSGDAYAVLAEISFLCKVARIYYKEHVR